MFDPPLQLSREIKRGFTVTSYIFYFMFLDRARRNVGDQYSHSSHQSVCNTQNASTNLTKSYIPSEWSVIFGIALRVLEWMLRCWQKNYLDEYVGVVCYFSCALILRASFAIFTSYTYFWLFCSISLSTLRRLLNTNVMLHHIQGLFLQGLEKK